MSQTFDLCPRSSSYMTKSVFNNRGEADKFVEGRKPDY